VGKRATKSRRILTPEDVLQVFDDERIRVLARHLPRAPDLNALGWWVRGAADLFALDVRIPNANQVHAEIATLHEAARRRSFEQVADLLERLSPEASTMLPVMPVSGDLRVEASRDEACNLVESLCRIGGQLVKGRRRKTGRRSRPTIQPTLYAPQPSRNPIRREAERHFVTRLSVAWCKATGKLPARTARHKNDSRAIGPFARFAKECLTLVGAKDVDVVQLINDLHGKTRPDG